jgi:hypothetical protein
MFYVRRNPAGLVVSLHREPQADAQEFVAADHADVQAFFGVAPAPASQPALAATTPRETFDRMDAELIRVVEDLVNVLIAKNVIDLTDLPPEAQAKLLLRKGFRERLAQQRLRAAGGRADFIDTLDDTKFGLLR